MPTYVQLAVELWWRAEVVPPSLAELGHRLVEHYGLDPAAVGSKGDNNHLYGYHRSAGWVRHSRYCTNRSYSVSETPGNRNPGDEDWVCALDVTLPRDELIAACQRLDESVRAGRLEKITEWYGNSDGDNHVDGYDNVRDRVASSDDSHLWHLHMSFDRGRANEDHSDVFAVLTGTTPTQPAQPSKEDDAMKGIMIQRAGQGIVLLYPHPVTGEMVWANIGYSSTIEAWSAAGWPGPVDIGDGDINVCGRPVTVVAQEVLAAVAAGGVVGGTGPSVAEIAEAVADEQAERQKE